jgi:hypothetical protein
MAWMTALLRLLVRTIKHQREPPAVRLKLLVTVAKSPDQPGELSR